MGLRPKNVAKVVCEWVTSVGFLPFVYRTALVVGGQDWESRVLGFGFWGRRWRGDLCLLAPFLSDFGDFGSSLLSKKGMDFLFSFRKSLNFII